MSQRNPSIPLSATTAHAPNGVAPASPTMSGFQPYRPRPSQSGVAPLMRPTALAKPPKGKWFVSILLIAFCGFCGYQAWTAFFRYRCHGTVVGRSIQVSPLWDGVVQALHVREGDLVRQGQLLMTVDNLELRQRQAQLADELKMAQANLAAQVARLKWESASQVVDRYKLGVAEYYEAWGKLLQEEARLQELGVSLSRAEELARGRAISREELDQIYFARQGQAQKVEKLKTSVEQLKKRMEQSTNLLENPKGDAGNLGSLGEVGDVSELTAQGQDQLKPVMVKIETIQAEMNRHQERLALGQIHATTNGRVVKVHQHAGEAVKQGEPVLTLLEEGSLQMVLYLPQDSSDLFGVGEVVELTVEPAPRPVSGRIVRIGDEYEAAPENIKRHYREGQKLLPVYLEPVDAQPDWAALRVGGVVKLPY